MSNNHENCVLFLKLTSKTLIEEPAI